MSNSSGSIVAALALGLAAFWIAKRAVIYKHNAQLMYVTSLSAFPIDMLSDMLS